MFKRINEYFLFDIYIAILKIEYVSSSFKNPEELKYSFIHWDSVIREFEIMGEAVNLLIKNDLLDNSYRVIVDFRNKIIHHYFGIDSEAVWDIIQNELKDFKSDIKGKILNLEDKLYEKLLTSFLEDNQNLKFIVEELKLLKG